jgi:hypothetical protein
MTKDGDNVSEWERLRELVRIGSQWVTLIGERWRDDRGQELDYWRVEKVDSVIVLPIQQGHILCAAPMFRVGIDRATLDFPGGRLPAGQQPQEMVPKLLERELHIPAAAMGNITALNQQKWIVNSSFSNQGLWGFAAEIEADFPIPESAIGMRVTANDRGISELLLQLDCLQCRMVLLEWQRQKKS